MEETKMLLGPNRVPGHREWLQLTYGQVREFGKTLTPEQLEQRVRVWGDEFGCNISEVKGKALVAGRNSTFPAITYLALMGAIDQLIPSELELPIEVECEDKSVQLYYIEELQEDFVSDGEDGVMPVSEMEDDDSPEHYPVRLPKGTLMFNTGS